MQLPFSNLQIEHWNPGATMALKLPVHVVCNTSDEQLFANIWQTSRRTGEWLKLSDSHNISAVLCGSGPSLADFLPQIAKMQHDGCKVFALNGSAKYLYDHGVIADYQVIIDARQQTSELVSHAREHLFASQVHPKCFELAPNAKVWHLQIEGIEDHFPPYEDDYCLIGGAASVGNTATCLAYSMGYRDLHLYGYDSSQRNGNSHAFSQPMNDGEPVASVTFGGKDYLCSLTMKLQAEKFQETSRSLSQLGCKIAVYGDGLLQDMFRAPKEALEEYKKYEKMWSLPEYRAVAPGEDVAQLFVDLTKSDASTINIDFGCGTGRPAKKIHDLCGCEFILVDFAENSLDHGIHDGDWCTLYLHDLTKPSQFKGKWGLCTDVMEHIPPQDIDSVLTNIKNAFSNGVLFQISLVHDHCGALIDEVLHLSVYPYDWWKAKLIELGFLISHEQMLNGNAVFFCEKE